VGEITTGRPLTNTDTIEQRSQRCTTHVIVQSILTNVASTKFGRESLTVALASTRRQSDTSYACLVDLAHKRIQRSARQGLPRTASARASPCPCNLWSGSLVPDQSPARQRSCSCTRCSSRVDRIPG
jgi:hypothetical protein